MMQSTTASVLRGLWEVMYLYASKTVLSNIYVGGEHDSNFIGTLHVYKETGNNANAVEVA